MAYLEELIKEAMDRAAKSDTTRPAPRTQKQALMEELVVAQRAVLEIGDIILGESGEELRESFTDADLAYAGGYLGAVSGTLAKLSNFVRNYPAE